MTLEGINIIPECDNLGKFLGRGQYGSTIEEKIVKI